MMILDSGLLFLGHPVNRCMFSTVDVRSVAHYAVTYGRNHSPLGRDLLFCTHRYKCSLCDIFNIRRIDGFIVKTVDQETPVAVARPCSWNLQPMQIGGPESGTAGAV